MSSIEVTDMFCPKCHCIIENDHAYTSAGHYPDCPENNRIVIDTDSHLMIECPKCSTVYNETLWHLEERERIVAYLRTPVVWLGPVSDDEDGHRVFMERALRFAADAIERGDYE